MFLYNNKGLKKSRFGFSNFKALKKSIQILKR